MDSFLPRRDQEYLISKGFLYSEIIDGTRNGLIIDNYTLPEGRFNVPAIKLLIFIPPNYNDANPDMFYCHPKVTFVGTIQGPPATDGIVEFNGVQWQQWSRHLNLGNDWRPGIDGIESYLQKVIHAFRTA